MLITACTLWFLFKRRIRVSVENKCEVFHEHDVVLTYSEMDFQAV